MTPEVEALYELEFFDEREETIGKVRVRRVDVDANHIVVLLPKDGRVSRTSRGIEVLREFFGAGPGPDAPKVLVVQGAAKFARLRRVRS